MGAEDDDLAVLREVVGLEVAAGFDVETAHAAVGKIDGLGLDGDDFGTVLDAEAVVGLVGDGAEIGKRVGDGFGVAFFELDLLSGALAAGLHGGLAAPEHDDVVADAEEPLEHALADRVAVAEEEDDGDESPDDAEHGEYGAHAIAAEGLDGLDEGFADFHKVLFRAEALHGREGGGAECRIHAGADGDGCECGE